ncbi:MAG: amidohydrolase family protein [Burkholderiaceae bacterium]
MSTTRHGLLHARSVLAHGIWLDDTDRALLRERGAQIAFCPSSNLFLGSGLFDWQAAADAGVQVSMASDVGARHEPVDAAHAGRWLQGPGAAGLAPERLEGCCTPRRWARRKRWVSTRRSAACSRAASPI